MHRAMLPLGLLAGVVFWTFVLTGNGQGTEAWGLLSFALIVWWLRDRLDRRAA